MHTRFIDRFDVILLDVSHTFMFDVDRFSDIEDYGVTYRQIGGNLLSNEEIRRIISALFDNMLADYENPNCYDSFPPVSSYLRTCFKKKKTTQELMFTLIIGAVNPDPMKGLNMTPTTYPTDLTNAQWDKPVTLSAKAFTGG